MPCSKRQADIDLTADSLCEPEKDPACKRSPKTAQPAHDDRFETEDQKLRSVEWIERRAHGDEHAGDCDHGERQCHGKCEDVAVLNAHQLGDNRIVGGGAEVAADRRAVKQNCRPPMITTATMNWMAGSTPTAKSGVNFQLAISIGPA